MTVNGSITAARGRGTVFVVVLAAALASVTGALAVSPTCRAGICLYLEEFHPLDPNSMQFYFAVQGRQPGATNVTHFNARLGEGIQRELELRGARSETWGIRRVPTVPLNVNVQSCVRGGLLERSRCSGWVNFSVSVPPPPAQQGSPAPRQTISVPETSPNTLRQGPSAGAQALRSMQQRAGPGGAAIPDQGVSPGSVVPGTASPGSSSGSSSPQGSPASTTPGQSAANPLHHGPATCKEGFVWRTARPEDLVCVTPESRARVAQENASAAERWRSNSRNCRSDYVRREAFAGDDVCVLKTIRNLVRDENRDGPTRRVQQ